MCTRFYVQPETVPVLIAKARQNALTRQLAQVLGREIPLVGELRPTDAAAVLALDRDRNLAAFPMLWGFTVPDVRTPIVNCRMETAADKPLWKAAWAQRRCAIPASWYYEWEHLTQPDGRRRTGTKFAIFPKRQGITWLAGLYRFEDRGGITVPVFAVLTRQPTEDVRRLHDRMPVILPQEWVRTWICRGAAPEVLASIALGEMAVEAADRRSYSIV